MKQYFGHKDYHWAIGLRPRSLGRNSLQAQVVLCRQQHNKTCVAALGQYHSPGDPGVSMYVSLDSDKEADPATHLS